MILDVEDTGGILNIHSAYLLWTTSLSVVHGKMTWALQTNWRLKKAAPTYISQGQSGRIYRHGPPCLLCDHDFRLVSVRCQYAHAQSPLGKIPSGQTLVTAGDIYNSTLYVPA